MNMINFWKEARSRYPKAYHHFHTWIAKYKKSNDWNKLFKHGVYSHEWQGQIRTFVAPEYEELPTAMQVGIFLEYLSYAEEHIRLGGFILNILVDNNPWDGMPEAITHALSIIEERL